MIHENRVYTIREATVMEQVLFCPETITPPIVVDIGGHTFRIMAVKKDDISLHRKGKDTFVLATRESVGYASLELLELTGGDGKSNVFLQNVKANCYRFWLLGRCKQADILEEYLP